MNKDKMTTLRDGNRREIEPTLTELAFGHLERLRSCEVKAEVQEKAVQCLVDYLGALISGLAAPWSAALLQYAKVASPGKGSAHVMGLDISLAAEVAAFTNAALAHR
jgi:2-methylcitrate dehydratase PrpD